MTARFPPDAAFPPSPVPSDANLWPGELPFTAWGQHAYGVLDLRVFDQEIWWVDIAQQPHRLEDMSADYIANVVDFLVRERKYFFSESMRRAWLQSYGDLLFAGLPADLAARVAGTMSDLTPQEWLEATPLMRALRCRAASRGAGT